MMAISNALKAALWMIGAVVSFSSMAVAGRELAAELDTFEIMMYRSFLGVLIVVVVAHLAGTLQQITRRRMGLHFIRNLSHFAGQNLWFYAVALVPFAQLIAFEFSTPLWVAVMAPLFLGERLTRVRVFAALMGFIGIIIVARPGSIEISPGIITAALCAVGFAGAYIATKLLSRTETTTCILFWLTVIQALLGIVFVCYDGDIALPSLAALPWVILVGMAGLLAHFCITTALQLAPAVIVSPMDFVRLPVMVFIGAMFYNESLDVWVMVGALLVFLANFWNIWAESKVPFEGDA